MIALTIKIALPVRLDLNLSQTLVLPFLLARPLTALNAKLLIPKDVKLVKMDSLSVMAPVVSQSVQKFQDSSSTEKAAVVHSLPSCSAVTVVILVLVTALCALVRLDASNVSLDFSSTQLLVSDVWTTVKNAPVPLFAINASMDSPLTTEFARIQETTPLSSFKDFLSLVHLVAATVSFNLA